MYGFQNNSVDGKTAGSFDYGSNTMLVSAEAGYGWEALENKKLVITPQLQIWWAGYQAEKAKNSVSNTEIQDDVTGSLAARLGFSASTSFIFYGRNIDPFMEIDWAHNSENIKASFNGEKFGIDKTGDSFVIKIGAGSWITDAVYAALSANGQNGGNDYQLFGGNLSVKYVW